MVATNPFRLLSKQALTHDVFELVFAIPSSDFLPQAGEYVIFDLAPGVKRAYSIAFFRPDDGVVGFIVKCVEGGKGSPILCGLQPGAEIAGMGPLGHFKLQGTDVSKCFIGTGTGFAPLYCQLLRLAAFGSKKPACLVFGARTADDLFYSKEIADLTKRFPNFSYVPYLSRDDTPETRHGYVTDFLTPENVAPYVEFYLCGSPAMVKDARAKLDELGVPKERVFFEQY